MAFVPHNAPLVVLVFLGTCLLLALAAVAFVWTLGAGRVSRALKIAGAGALLFVLYAVVLLGRARTLPDHTLAVGESKYFCEIDCHLAYTVVSVARERALGEGNDAVMADGVFLVVTVRTWFDERTISTRRSRERPLGAGPRHVRVVDAAGRSWQTSLRGQEALRGSTVSLMQPIRPGESFETQFVFDVPAEAGSLRLLLTDAFPLTTFLIGHENSPGAGRIYFALPSGGMAASTIGR